MKKFLILASLSFIFLTCNKPEEEKSPSELCAEREESLQGIYSVEIISYPLQPRNEGEIEYARISVDLNCYANASNNRNTITIHELFDNNCQELSFGADGTFEVRYSDDVYWWGALVRGKGRIKNNKLTFNGKVISRFDSDTIVLESNNFEPTTRYCP